MALHLRLKPQQEGSRVGVRVGGMSGAMQVMCCDVTAPRGKLDELVLSSLIIYFDISPSNLGGFPL